MNNIFNIKKMLKNLSDDDIELLSFNRRTAKNRKSQIFDFRIKVYSNNIHAQEEAEDQNTNEND